MANIEVRRDGAVTIVAINRPDARNAVDGETADLLFNAFLEFDKDPSTSVAILTSTEGAFCAGADLKAMGTERQNTVTTEGPGPMGPTRMTLSKPVIAAVEGYAVAGGLELALWCDLRVAASDAAFGVFCRRWGVPLIDGGTVRLPRLIGHSRAMDMILTGREVSASEALDIGLINRVVPPGEALAHATDLARTIAEFPQACLRSDRASALAQWGRGEEEALAFETKVGIDTLRTGESLEGARRFAEGAGRHGEGASRTFTGAPRVGGSAAAVWNERAAQLADDATAESVQRHEWTYHPKVAEYQRALGGGRLREWLPRSLPDECDHVVAIGPGLASVELELVISGRVERLTLVDVSEDSLVAAKANAEANGVGHRVETVCASFEDFIGSVAPGSLDAMTFIASLHHIDDVPEVLRLTRTALRPGGVVVGSEYVGPNRFAFPDEVKIIADKAYRSLPTELRGDWPILPSPDPVEVASFDPSEAIDSERILESVREIFPDHEILEMGGGIIHLVWYGVDHDAMFESQLGGAAIQRLIDEEQELMAAGTLPSYFARFIGRV